MSENSIEFSLSNSEQRDSWLNSGHQTLDADTYFFVQLLHINSPNTQVHNHNECKALAITT